MLLFASFDLLAASLWLAMESCSALYCHCVVLCRKQAHKTVTNSGVADAIKWVVREGETFVLASQWRQWTGSKKSSKHQANANYPAKTTVSMIISIIRNK